jgi:AcrR family transcriptional regulator
MAKTPKAKAAKAAVSRPRGRRSTTSGEGDRTAKAAARREAILDAALDEFSARGFEAARLDDVARRAGVAKGTIYLYFADKQSLFFDLIRSRMSPVIGAVQTSLAADLPLPVIIDSIVEIILREVFGTPRQQMIRLIISEGPRFPALAEFYYREVLSRILGSARVLLRRAAERGELPDDTLARFPQLLGAPLVTAIVWGGLFDRFEPLDVHEMLRAYFRALFAGRRASP